MMKSMFSAVSGLRVHQIKMDVIGNNIANVNTVGFKGSKVSFSETLNQTIRGASGPSNGVGGTNPQQVGLGVSLGSIDVVHSKGSTQRTDNVTDLMIDGNGYFVLSNSDNAENKFYTRAGNFTVDKEGYLVSSNGFKVLDKDMKPIQINKSDTKSATETGDFIIKGNLNFKDENYSTSFDFYDSLGKQSTIKINFTGLPLTTNAPVALSNTDPRFGQPGAPVNSNYSFRKVDFSTNGVSYPTVADKDVYAMFNENGDFCDLVNIQSAVGATPDPNSIPTPVSQSLNISSSGAKDMTFQLDRTLFFESGDITKNRTFTQYSQATEIKGELLSGNSAGSINSFTIGSTGEVFASFTNGEKEVVGIIGLADFDNPSGLMKTGNNMFSQTVNSGNAKYGEAAKGSFGSLTPGALEMSNVDLAAEFTEMITTQRGFQANSRIITTTDQMLETIVSLGR